MASNNEYGGATYSGNYYYFLDCSNIITNAFFSSARNGVGCGPAFTAGEALAYDAKIDDAKPASGLVIGFNNIGGLLGNTLRFGNSPAQLPATGYDTSSNDVAYALAQKVAPDLQK